MLLADLLGERLTSDDPRSSVFEGPLAGTRTALDLADTRIALRRLGQLLSSGGARRRVGILGNHQLETYLAVLACATGQHTFVPLNPKFPAQRLRDLVALADLDVVLTDPSMLGVSADLVPGKPVVDVSEVVRRPREVDEEAQAERWAAEALSAPVDPGHTAYLMFTSGSTGVPKGVPISFGNLTNYVRGVSELLDIEHGLRHTQFFDLSFDLSMHDLFVTNYLGGTLVAPSMIDLLVPSGYLTRERIDVWFSVPLLGAQLGRAPRHQAYPGLRHLLFCGEALPMETVEACRGWLADGGHLWNLYGPTEATIAFTAARVTESERPEGNASIGRPFGGNRVALLSGQQVEDRLEEGHEGELLLGGPQVFDGYSTDVASPFLDVDGTRWYRSGDLVRIDHEGVYFRGRVDSQVKYRGYRIELGEIETVCRAAYGLRTVAAVLHGQAADASIVAYYLAEELGGDLDPARLADRLPAYMVPTAFVPLAEMPVNSNGKIDRNQLARREL